MPYCVRVDVNPKMVASPGEAGVENNGKFVEISARVGVPVSKRLNTFNSFFYISDCGLVESAIC